MSIELTFPEDYSREELINGEVVLMAPALPPHVRISGNIFGSFLNYLKDKKCAPIADGVTVFLSDTEHYVPDFMVVCDPDKIKRDGVHGAPDLVVEVLSPSTAKYDRGHKMRAYQRRGVREYWIVDPVNRAVEQYLLRDGTLELETIYAIFPGYALAKMTEEERAAIVTRFKCSLFDDFEIALEDIFSGMLPEPR